MKGYIKYWYSGLISISLVLGLITLVPLAQANSATQRPIEDFVSTQGTFCIDDGMGGCFLFVPPIENFFGLSDPKANLCMSIDYAGLADAWISSVSGGGVSFGTTFEGTVTERPLTGPR